MGSKFLHCITNDDVKIYRKHLICINKIKKLFQNMINGQNIEINR